MLYQAFGSNVLSKMTYKLIRHFKSGRTLADNDKRFGEPVASRSEPLTGQVKPLSIGSCQPHNL
jgi:hypothetical protein